MEDPVSFRLWVVIISVAIAVVVVGLTCQAVQR